MKAGEFPDGSRTLRAKIDMASPNLNLRDPVMYRILHAEHHRTGNKWCIYPMYDFAHGQSDSIEGITHSICTLEFEDHRPLYDWYIEQLGIYHPQQIEFDRLNLTYTLLSKRKLLQLVQDGHVRGWDDPRMPTLSGIRRRGYTPEAIRNFCGAIGVSKTNGIDRTRPARTLRPRRSQQARPARDGRAAPAARRHRQLSRRPGRRDGSRQQSRRSRRRHAQSAVLATCSTSSRTISAKIRRSNIFRLSPGTRSAPALRLLHHVHRRREGRAGRSRRSPLHLRSRHPRRQRARRPQGESHHPLGLRRARRRRRGPPLRQPLH